MGLQVVGDSCRTEWTFVQKQCSFVSPWPLEACWGLALASRQKCLHSCFIPWPPTVQEPAEDTAGGLCVWGWVLWGWRRDGELKLDSWGRCVPVLVLLLVSVWHRLSSDSLGSSFLMCLRIWNLQWLKVLSRVSGSPNWWMGAVYCQSSSCWVNRAFLNLFLKK